ncbi:MAG TPA: SDR family oxidoreductase [Acidimicrobiales bacterium]|nr:SDR family oxidoreductase [Acidimicrobiales bacterium]
MALSRFNDRSVLVTGAASGIGRATALRLAEEGAVVVAADINAQLLEKLAVDADGLGRSVTSLVADVSSESGIRAMVAEAVDRLGKLDVVVNVAGILSFSHTHELSLDEWNRLISVNLTGTFLVCREVLPHLLATKGNIVNLASTAAHKGQPWATAYVASKGGVLSFTRSLAVEYAAQGLRVNSISPGGIDTPITGAFQLPEGADIRLLNRVTPMAGFGTPDGIAAAIAYVASDEGSHMNGADIVIDGATIA